MISISHSDHDALVQAAFKAGIEAGFITRVVGKNDVTIQFSLTGDFENDLASADDTPTAEYILGLVDQARAEIELSELRRHRDQLLRECDWWAYSDTPEMTEAQIAYRQALRDITNTYTSLDDVVWPTKPE